MGWTLTPAYRPCQIAFARIAEARPAQPASRPARARLAAHAKTWKSYSQGYRALRGWEASVRYVEQCTPKACDSGTWRMDAGTYGQAGRTICPSWAGPRSGFPGVCAAERLTLTPSALHSLSGAIHRQAVVHRSQA